eukprot:SAG22_NODE_7577_length_727_cov_1.192675_1_plen_112_part_01
MAGHPAASAPGPGSLVRVGLVMLLLAMATTNASPPLSPAQTAFFETTEARRAERYLQSSAKWLREFERVQQKEDANEGQSDEDSFVFGWLAAQHFFAGAKFGSNSSAVMAQA